MGIMEKVPCKKFYRRELMCLDGLDELDQKIIRLLIENARISYCLLYTSRCV